MFECNESFLFFYFTESQLKYIQVYTVVTKKMISQSVAMILTYKYFTLIATDEYNT